VKFWTNISSERNTFSRWGDWPDSFHWDLNLCCLWWWGRPRCERLLLWWTSPSSSSSSWSVSSIWP